MTDSLPSDKWIPARLKESVSLRQADSRLLFWQFGGSAISQTGPVNPSHPHRIHLIALSQFLSEVRNGVSPSQERELLNGRNTEKKFYLCQRMSEAFTFLSTICFWPFKLRNFNSKLKRENFFSSESFMINLWSLLNSAKGPFHQNMF